MKSFAYVIIICTAYVLSRALPVAIDRHARLQQQREGREFLLELKGVQVIKPSAKLYHL